MRLGADASQAPVSLGAEKQLCSWGAGILRARGGWGAGVLRAQAQGTVGRRRDSPSAITAPAQPRTDKAIQKSLLKAERIQELLTSLKEVSCRCHKTQKQKTRLKPNRPHPKTFQHAPHYLKQSPYGLDSKVHRGGVSGPPPAAALRAVRAQAQGPLSPSHLCAPRPGLSTELWEVILSGFGQSV